jgi:hypothetical protein
MLLPPITGPPMTAKLPVPFGIAVSATRLRVLPLNR